MRAPVALTGADRSRVLVERPTTWPEFAVKPGRGTVSIGIRWDDRPSHTHGESRGPEGGSGAAPGVEIGRVLDEAGRGCRVRVWHRRGPGPQFGTEAHRSGRHRRDGRAVGAPRTPAGARRLGHRKRKGRCGGMIPLIGHHVLQEHGEQHSVRPGGDEVRATGLHVRGREQHPRHEREHRAGGEWSPSSRRRDPCHFRHGRDGNLHSERKRGHSAVGSGRFFRTNGFNNYLR